MWIRYTFYTAGQILFLFCKIMGGMAQYAPFCVSTHLKDFKQMNLDLGELRNDIQ